jgi:hypothetical protein
LPASLRTDGLIAHLTLQFRTRGERGDRVDRDEIDRPGADEHVDDLQRLLAIVGLGDEQLVDVDPDLLGVERIHRVLGVDERAHATELLGLGDDVVDERRLARRLRAEDLDDPSAGDAADAERDVKRERTGGDRITVDAGAGVAHPHHAALAELALDLREGPLERGLALGGRLGIGRAGGYASCVLAHARSCRHCALDSTR